MKYPGIGDAFWRLHQTRPYHLEAYLYTSMECSISFGPERRQRRQDSVTC